MKTRIFDTWLQNKLKLDEALRELNEAFDDKDEQRIKDIIGKSWGDSDKELRLAQSMANKITDGDKALRRAEAAEALGKNEIAHIFLSRAEILSGPRSGTKKVPVSNTDDELSDDSEEEEAPRKVSVPRTSNSVSTNHKIGDYFKTSAKMILDGDKVGISDRKHWRFITAKSTGNRELEMNVHTPPTAPKYSRKRGYSTQGSPGSAASSYIDREFLQELGDQAIFYIKAHKVSSSWIEGEIKFSNGINSLGTISVVSGSKYNRQNQDMPHMVRFKVKDIVPNGVEINIFTENEEKIQKSANKKFFVIGDEDFLMKEDGSIDNNIVPGQYAIRVLNHSLSVMANDPVMYCTPSTEWKFSKDPKMFFGSIDKLATLDEDIKNSQTEVIAEFLAKELDAEIISDDGDFKIPWFKVSGSNEDGYLSSYGAGPFFSRESAENHAIEIRKNVRAPYSTKNINVIQGGTWNIDFTKIMDFAKLAGIEVKLRKFFEEKRGNVASKEFNF